MNSKVNSFKQSLGNPEAKPETQEDNEYVVWHPVKNQMLDRILTLGGLDPKAIRAKDGKERRGTSQKINVFVHQLIDEKLKELEAEVAAEVAKEAEIAKEKEAEVKLEAKKEATVIAGSNPKEKKS